MPAEGQGVKDIGKERVRMRFKWIKSPKKTESSCRFSWWTDQRIHRSRFGGGYKSYAMRTEKRSKTGRLGIAMGFHGSEAVTLNKGEPIRDAISNWNIQDVLRASRAARLLSSLRAMTKVV